MASMILLFILAFVFYQKSRHDMKKEFIYEYTSYFLAMSAFLTYMFLFLQDKEFKPSLYCLAFLPLFYFCFKYIKEKTKPKPLDIVANQQRYFKEAKAKDIVNFYKVRKSIKSNRVEALVNKESKKLIKNGFIVPQFFLDFHNFTLSEVKNIDELNENALFKAVFAKVTEFIKQRELKIDFEKVIKENEFKAEFFLMNLWEENTKPFNISLANLELLAKNEQEIELLGALDLLNLNCVKRKGAVLFYKYMEFKDRIKDYIKQEKQENNPKEQEFDEEYAKDMDSDKSPYKDKK